MSTEAMVTSQTSETSQNGSLQDEATTDPTHGHPPCKRMHFDPGYLSSTPGILKLVQAITGLIGFICAQTIRYSVYHSAGTWYTIVSMPAFLISSIFIICYVFHIVEKFKKCPWLLIEMGYAIIWCILFFIAASVAATRVREDPPWVAATFFGFLGMTAFGYDAFMKYKRWERHELAQGTRSNVDITSETDNNNI